MRRSRRQAVNRIFELTGIGLVVLDMSLFFAVYRPLGEKLAAETHHHAELRQGIRNQQVRLEVLKKFEAALPQAGRALESFKTSRTPPRREAFSTAAHLIHKLADASGVKVSTLGYRLEIEHKDPLERLELDINAQGSYEALLKFSHALETANDFVLIREFTISPSGENGTLAMRLGTDLYVTP